MIPIVSPPTDNLYKLMALFGLGVLILGIVNSNTQSEAIIKTKIEIEYIEKQIVDTIHYFNRIKETKEKHFISTSKNKGVSALIDEISKDQSFGRNNNLPKKVAIYIDTELDIMNVKLLAIKKQESLNNLLIIFSLLLMIFGFTLWYLKEQRWHDKKVRNNINDELET